jgi:hypothetical protein
LAALILRVWCRALQDYTVLYFGSAVFKIARLLAIALLCVHCFACAFFKVKQQSADPQEVALFYLSRGVDVDPIVSRLGAASTHEQISYLLCKCGSCQYASMAAFDPVGSGPHCESPSSRFPHPSLPADLPAKTRM